MVAQIETLESLEALPIGASVVALHQKEGGVLTVTDTRTDGTCFYHSVTWRDAGGRPCQAEYDRKALLPVAD